MYKQTDERIAIYAQATDVKTKVFKRYNVMKKWGCLFISLLYLAEQVTGKLFSPQQIKFLYRALNGLNYLRKDMYVYNHEEVIKAGIEVLGHKPSRVIYIGKEDELHPEKSWMKDLDNNYKLIQILTPNGNGHFKHENFDPYDPPVKMIQLMSRRYYLIEID
jgi:hypothetical protein